MYFNSYKNGGCDIFNEIIMVKTEEYCQSRRAAYEIFSMNDE